MEPLLEKTLDLVEGCSCEEGCPACIHSPKCGAGNTPLDKAACTLVLQYLLGRRPLFEEAATLAEEDPWDPVPVEDDPAPERRKLPSDTWIWKPSGWPRKWGGGTTST